VRCFIGGAREPCDSTLETCGKLEAGGRHGLTPASLGSQKVLPTRIEVKLSSEPVSYRRLLAQRPFIVPIPGTAKVQHLEENIGASNVLSTAEDLKEIESALSNLPVLGGRMNQEQMKVAQA
jgi:hypothetical protein